MSEATSRFRFLDLPREIRDKIYFYHVQGSFIVAHVGKWTPNSVFDLSPANERRVQVNLGHSSYQLTRTCRQIWNESCNLLKEATTELVIHVENALILHGGDCWAHAPLISFLRHVHHLHIVTKDHTKAIMAEFLNKDTVPNLQTINYLIDYSDAQLLEICTPNVLMRLENKKPKTAQSMLEMTRLHLRKQTYGGLRGPGRGRDPPVPTNVFLVAPLWPLTERSEDAKFGMVAFTDKRQNGSRWIAWSEAAMEIGHAEATTLDLKRRRMLEMGAALRTAKKIRAPLTRWM